MPPKGGPAVGPPEDLKAKGKQPLDQPPPIRPNPVASKEGKQRPEKLARRGEKEIKWVDPNDPTKPYKKKPNTRNVPYVSPIPTTDVSQTSSVKSEPTYTRNAKPRHFSRQHYDTTAYINLGERPKRGVNRTALMLTVGQGGTFSNGAYFMEKNLKTGEMEKVLVDAALEIGSTKARNLRSYGAGVDFIGTSECLTCLGIYFELTGNRCFCAHVNAWMGPDTFSHGLTEHDPETKEIRDQFVRRMEAHANEMGWTKDNYRPGTLYLTSTWKTVLAYALQDALQEFLGIKDRPYTSWRHGFMIMPQILSKNKKTQGHFLSVEWAHPDEDGDRAQEVHYALIPENWKTVPYTEADGRKVADEWTYTAGLGWHVHNRNGIHTGYKKY